MNAKEFKKIRIQLELDQKQMAGKLGCDRATVTRYENGRMKITTQTEIATRNIVELARLRT